MMYEGTKQFVVINDMKKGMKKEKVIGTLQKKLNCTY